MAANGTPSYQFCKTNEHIIVVEAETRSFDVFSQKGRHLRHQILAYQPCGWKAVTAYRPNHVIVASIVPSAGAALHSQLHLHHLFDDPAPHTNPLVVKDDEDQVPTLIKAIRFVEESDQLYLVYKKSSGEDAVFVWSNIYKYFVSDGEIATSPPDVNISEQDEVTTL